MARIGVGKRGEHDGSFDEQVKHDHVPGMAYNVENPAARLINMIGGGFFNEAKYYDPNRSDEDFHAELKETGKISVAVLDADGLSAQAREVIETAREVARGGYEGAQPDDLCIIAAWARDPQEGLKLRTTPQILYAVAADVQESRPVVGKYGPQIMRRPDDAVQAFAFFRDFSNPKQGRLHKGMLPHQFRKGIRAAMAEYSDYQLLKYNNKRVRPTLGDVAVMIGGTSGYPLSKPMFEYIVNDKIVEGAPEVLHHRQVFFQMSKQDFAALSPVERSQLIERAQLTWENVNSHLGDKENPSAEVWEAVIPQMNEMALLRNLRNFEKAGISPAAWREVNNKLLNVERSTQLPFRFLTAHSAVETENAKTICELMLDKACENVPNLEGTTVVFADNSGSCTGCAVSGKSELKVSDAGNILEAIIAKRFGERAKVGVFGDNFVWVDVNPADSCLKIKAKIDSVAKEENPAKNGGLGIPSIIEKYSRLNVRGVGGATETGLWFGINDLIQKKIHTDRIILCSDLCCYTQGDMNCGHSMTPYFGKNATVQGLVDKYRREVNPNVQVYSINLNGGKQAQTRLDANSHALSGWSENVFKIIADLESPAERDERQPVAVPTLEVLRARYRV